MSFHVKEASAVLPIVTTGGGSAPGSHSLARWMRRRRRLREAARRRRKRKEVFNKDVCLFVLMTFGPDLITGDRGIKREDMA